MLLAEYLTQRYVPSRLELTAGSAEQLSVAVRLFSRFLGRDALVEDLAKPVMLRWLHWLGEGRSPATVNGRRNSLLTLWRAAADDDLAPEPGRLPRRREPLHEPVAWTLAEVGRLFAAAAHLRGDWDGLPVSLAWEIALSVTWDTAIRVGTLLRAELAHVDVDRQLLWVPAENVKGRFRSHRFALHQDTTALIRRSLFWPRRFLFPLPVGLKQSPDHLRRLLRAAHLPSDRKHLWHCLRRTAESHAAAAMGIEWAAAAVGHTVAVAKRSYIAPAILGEHRLCDVLPRPAV